MMYRVSTVVCVIFCLVAAGCYGIEEMIPRSGPGLTIIMLCILPFVWGFPFGMITSELSSLRPGEGGYYRWVQEALGEFWGFQAVWWRTLSVYLGNAAYIILAGGYAARIWDMEPKGEFILKLCMIIVFSLVALKGIGNFEKVSRILTLVVAVAFGSVAICGLINWGGDVETASTISFQLTPEPAGGIRDWFFYIAGGLSIGMWMYSGYESVSSGVGKHADPEVVPKGIMITIPIMMMLYILPTTLGLGSLGNWSSWGTGATTEGYSDVIGHFWGQIWGMLFIVIAVMIQCFVYYTYVSSGSAGLAALAEDRLAPGSTEKKSGKFRTPYVTVITMGAVSLLMCMLPFRLVIVLTVALLTASYVLVYLSAAVLRRRIPRKEYHFRIPGGKIFMGVICILPLCTCLFALYVNGSAYYICTAVGIITGPLMYYIWRRSYGGLSMKDPVKYPYNRRTGLGAGDPLRIVIVLAAVTILNITALLFEPRYEGWGENGGRGITAFTDGMFESADPGFVSGAVSMALWAITIICAAAAAVIYLLWRRAEK